MTSKPVKLHQVGDNVPKGNEVGAQQKQMMLAEAKRRLIIKSKK